jgi:hypothetical protein
MHGRNFMPKLSRLNESLFLKTFNALSLLAFFYVVMDSQAVARKFDRIKRVDNVFHQRYLAKGDTM